MDEFRILITGSRDWNDPDLIEKILSEYTIYPHVTLVSGSCPTCADKFCEDVGELLGWRIERHPADWNKYGKRAGFIRNSEMVNAGANVCLAFIKDESKGATMTKGLAEKKGIETRVFRNEPWKSKVPLASHQLEALNKLDNGKILWGDVGSGKSRVAAAYYMKVEADADVYVITPAKKRDSLDWEQEFARFGVGKSRTASVAGGILTVDSWNNIGKYRDVVGGFFIFDEQRLVGSGDWSNTFLEIAKKNRWILLTATPGDVWLDYVPVFIANGFYKNRTEFKREHVIYNTYSKFPKVDRYVGVGKLVRARHSLLVEMPIVRTTTRNIKQILVPYDKALFERVVKDRWHVYENRPLRDVAELFSVMRKVVNSDSTRVSELLKLLETHPRLIVFYNFNYELEALREALASVQNGEMNQISVGLDSRESNESSQLWTSQVGPSSTDFMSPPSDSSEFEECSGVSPLEGQRLAGRNKWGLTGSTTSSMMETTTYTNTSSTTPRSKSNLPTEKFTTSTEVESSRNLAKKSTSTSSNTRMSLAATNLDPASDTTQTALQVAEWNGHKHQAVPTSSRWVYLVQYTAGAEGWNCITTDTTVFFSLTYSYKQWHQAHGRTDRMNTPFRELNYYTFLSNSAIDRAILNSLNEKRSFNENDYMRNSDIMGRTVHESV